METKGLLAALSPPLDSVLVEQLLREFLAVERRYVLGDWEPATLDGGQFAEIASRITYHIDSGNLNRRKSVDNCLSYVEEESNAHSFSHRRSALHLCKVLRTLYKFRSQRGAVHIDPDYSANELDSMLVISIVRWIMSEIIRIFWSGDRAEVARAIKEIVRYEVPAVLNIDHRYLVSRVDCSIEEEVILLLHNAGEDGLSSSELSASIPKPASSVRGAISKLGSAQKREIVKRATGRYTLMPLGLRRIREELADKLTI